MRRRKNEANGEDDRNVEGEEADRRTSQRVGDRSTRVLGLAPSDRDDLNVGEGFGPMRCALVTCERSW